MRRIGLRGGWRPEGPYISGHFQTGEKFVAGFPARWRNKICERLASLQEAVADAPHVKNPADCRRRLWCKDVGGQALSRQILGDIVAGGKKALFLRTYSKDVSLILSKELPSDAKYRQRLIEKNVRVVRRPETITLANSSSVTILTQGGEKHELDALYPALGCAVRSKLAITLGATCSENGNCGRPPADDSQRPLRRG